ncbi:MAG: hypothetical protein AMJ53_00075 [Gammaproteobacteria bacterium SG8_11]|nr:MAG: hypothetical protein AMJ53_00075 [Gammaproteobacteria bacterium SG8_11]
MKKVLIIHTGGTFGMLPEKPKRILNKQELADQIIQVVPRIEEIAAVDFEMIFNMDSSNIQIEHWQQLAVEISNKIDDYDGFVIIHGTDSMVYTASALSFMLRKLPKPVVLTGSLRPLAEIRTDARNNLVNAVDFATYPIGEVCIFIGNKLYRGNRTIKISNTQYDAFKSPNFPPLAEVGTEVKLFKYHLPPQNGFHCMDKLSDEVFVIRFFPGLNPKYLDWVIDNPAKVLIIEALGYGNLPVEKKSFVNIVSKITSSGNLVVITSQSSYAKVDLTQYENGLLVQQAGAIGAGDMTKEAAITKLMHILGYYSDNLEKVREMFPIPLAGEISESEWIEK